MSGMRQEEDTIATPRIVFIGVTALVTFAVGIWWAVTIQRGDTGTLKNDTAPKAAYAGRREIGMVYQPPFETVEIAAEKYNEKRKLLSNYGWADPEKKTIHIPIQRAMDMMVQRGKL
jgi:hypothetical protein